MLLNDPDLRRLLDEGNFPRPLFFCADDWVVDPGDDGGMGGPPPGGALLLAISEPVMGLGGKWNDTDPTEGDPIPILEELAFALAVLLFRAPIAEA